MSTKLQTPPVLAFEGKLVPSDAVMFSGNWDVKEHQQTWQPIEIVEKSVRGTISNRLASPSESDPAKIDAKVQNANPQTVDNAALPYHHDSLKVNFTLKILGELTTPSACSIPEYQKVLTNIINAYKEKYGFSVLAIRYAMNIANGRFLWRNRVGAEAVEVHVSANGQPFVFDSQAFSLRVFDSVDSQLIALAKIIEDGLEGKSFTLLSVTAFVKLGAGQPIYPSQELVMAEDKERKSKYLYQLNGVAAMHSQKIGNALRTIDTWHPENSEVGAIAVEPYGSVTNRGKAYRQPTEKLDFYNLLDNWVLKDKVPDVDQQHYVIAMLIRGGVFGKSKKE